MAISVVINTRNEEKNLPRCLASVKGLADEIVVTDMESIDKTVEIAKKAGAKVFKHKQTGYVEPARNYAISKATGEWILILDADEETPPSLVKKLKQLVKTGKADYYRLPRKNIVFGRWLEYSRWWPDYNIRFFKKGKVVWNEIIHSVPVTQGKGLDLEAKLDYAIVHHNYNSVSQYIVRMDRYTDIQAKALIGEGYKFDWQDLVKKPVGEFLSRYFVGEGYKDNVHGIALALLQALSEAVIYIKVWERGKFKEEEVKEPDIENVITEAEAQIDHWLVAKKFRHPGVVGRALRKLLR